MSKNLPLKDGLRLQNLAEFRYELRRFLQFSESCSAEAGLHPQQHQLLLQLAGAPAGVETTVSYAAERLGLRHHTVVELSKRCEDAGLCTPILCASKVVGVINLQHHLTYHHKENEVRLLSMLGFLVGAEIERARVETENAQLANRLESRKAVERAKGALYCNVTWV